MARSETNEQVKVEAANGAITETGYDGAGQAISQTDGDKHTTKYVRNVLEQVTETIDPLLRKTTKEYDLAGNLKTVTDPAKRTATYTYDAANRLTEVKYSDGKTLIVKYEYDKDDNRTKMVDGTGTTSYTYDQLDRLTEAKDGHGAACVRLASFVPPKPIRQLTRYRKAQAKERQREASRLHKALEDTGIKLDWCRDYFRARKPRTPNDVSSHSSKHSDTASHCKRP